MSEQPPDITGRIVAHRGAKPAFTPVKAKRLHALAGQLAEAAEGDGDISGIAHAMVATGLAAGADDSDHLLVNTLVWRLHRLDDESLAELAAGVEREMAARTTAEGVAGPSCAINRSIPRGTTAPPV